MRASRLIVMSGGSRAGLFLSLGSNLLIVFIFMSTVLVSVIDDYNFFSIYFLL